MRESDLSALSLQGPLIGNGGRHGLAAKDDRHSPFTPKASFSYSSSDVTFVVVRVVISTQRLQIIAGKFPSATKKW